MKEHSGKRTLLVSAYGCEPGRGSEQGVGWNWVLQLAKDNCVHIITREKNRAAIEAAVPDELKKSLVFHYYDAGTLLLKMKRGEKSLYFYYWCWQIGIIPIVRKLIREYQFDYTWHLTFGSIWMPTFLPLFKVPFIWGPIGGGESVPVSFLKQLPFKQRILESVRYLLKPLCYINPLVLQSCYRASAIVVRTTCTLSFIPRPFRHKAVTYLETAMDRHEFSRLHPEEPYAESDTVRLIYTGRLAPLKNVITTIRALSLVSDLNIHFTIIGAGPEFVKINKAINLYRLQDKVKLLNQKSRLEVIEYLNKSDIYLFPSLREGGTWALMEAMATGIPVICLKWAGMEIITDDSCAVRLAVTNPEQMAKDMAEAIRKLVENRDLRLRMGRAGKQRIAEVFSWNEKGRFANKLMTESYNKNKR